MSTIVLQPVFKLDGVSLLGLDFRIVLALLGLLPFHVNFRISLQDDLLKFLLGFH